MNIDHNFSRETDKFYTKDHVAKMCVTLLEEVLPSPMKDYAIVEPSAGGGAFLRAVDSYHLAFDILPECDGIEVADYLTLPKLNSEKKIVTLGNPPFGKNSSKAVKFFNRAAMDSDVIAFILPKTFRKSSIINRCDEWFEIVLDRDLPARSFTFSGVECGVPCVFQVWVKRKVRRQKASCVTVHEDFDFVSKDLAEVALQRVGANAGMLHYDFGKRSASSHYFLQFNTKGARDFFTNYDFRKIASNTAGCPSLAKSEIVNAYVAWQGVVIGDPKNDTP